ncbi:MAG: hypothetical protein KF749_05390 [Bacteroidetes bacterium]|nr:hypothetical protein [Bacteroidota bacterium]MCW5896429.1 hypothetical protein [Bacteroidota bacterium]
MSVIHTIDVAHPPRHPDVVERELSAALSMVRNSKALCILKIIHGHGSSGKGGSTREVVRNWAFRQRSRVREVINGEDYEMYNADVQEMRGEVGQYPDIDLNCSNPGITVLWVK